MKIAIVHKSYLGDNYITPEWLTLDGIKTVKQRVTAGTWGHKNHKTYADTNGYTFIDDREDWYDSKPPDWSIWQAALRALKDPNLDADWIFFSVSDIVYTDFNKRLEPYLEECPDSCFMATGTYVSNLKWGLKNIRSDSWELVVHNELQPFPMISGWSHFIRKCPEAIEFVEWLDKDTRVNNFPSMRNNSFTGDIYLSFIFNGYPEYRKYWHLFKTKDHIRIPQADQAMKNWNKVWNLEEYEQDKALMVFTTCYVSVDETIRLQEKYTKEGTYDSISNLVRL